LSLSAFPPWNSSGTWPALVERDGKMVSRLSIFLSDQKVPWETESRGEGQFPFIILVGS
jgi:hypothetical protein